MKISALLAGVGVATLMVSGAQAADLLLPAQPVAPVVDTSIFSFDGFYAGVTGGGAWVSGGCSAGSIGVVAGANFTVADPILLGIEGQFDGLIYNGGLNGYDALILGKIGVLASPQVLVYASLGGGWVHDNAGGGTTVGTWAYGGGVEVAVTDNMSIRGEVLGLHMPDAVNQNAAKATIGVLFHF